MFENIETWKIPVTPRAYIAGGRGASLGSKSHSRVQGSLRVAHSGVYAVGERAYIVAKRKIGADACHRDGHQDERVFR